MSKEAVEKFHSSDDKASVYRNYVNTIHSVKGASMDAVLLFLSSNPQPIGFRGNLLVKRQKFFYCTYSLGITETS